MHLEAQCLILILSRFFNHQPFFSSLLPFGFSSHGFLQNAVDGPSWLLPIQHLIPLTAHTGNFKAPDSVAGRHTVALFMFPPIRWEYTSLCFSRFALGTVRFSYRGQI